MYGFPRTQVRIPRARVRDYTFDPRSWGPVELWYNSRLSSVVEPDHSRITLLKDLSGNDRHAAPTGPIWATLVPGAYRKHPGVFLQNPFVGGTIPIVGTAPRTVVVSCIPLIREGGYRAFLSWGTSASNGAFVLQAQPAIISVNTASLNVAAGTLTVTLGDWMVLGATYNGTAVSVYSNGAWSASSNIALGTVAGPVWIGGRSSHNDMHTSFILFEAIVWSVSLSAADMVSVYSELSRQYG